MMQYQAEKEYIAAKQPLFYMALFPTQGGK
jgi:hypothetical protein